ncbi:MAG: aldehyde ferredoxin oxidoreductase family protein [Deltaproteobacteria bacterium]|nr:aldehyde ferredoxin oxidoreductase family protein [Deltaproteobacteria bacterium]
MGTWWNRFLEVDLSNRTMNTFSLDQETLYLFIGGSGLGARLFWDRQDPQVDPFSVESEIYMLTGPLAGTGFPGSSRLAVCARSPLTGIWGESTVGGNVAPELKRTGYDGIIVKGKADAPVVLIIDEQGPRLESAANLWGKETYDVIDEIKSRSGDGRPYRVLAIGPAGEKLVKFACLCNDKGDFAGRTGMGAVMGSKNLKAVVLRGNNKPLLARSEGAREWTRELNKKVRENMTAQSLHEMGTDANMDLGMMTGDVPVENWTKGEAFDLSSSLGGPALADEFLVRAGACESCPIACKRICKVDSGPYAMEKGPGPEYETCATFGTMIGNGNLAGVCKVNERCNRLGMDTISCGSVVAWFFHMAEKGLLSGQELGGVSAAFGNLDAAIELVELIGRREGIGDVLAEGSRKAAEILGKGEDLTVEVKGLEAPMHDPRTMHGMGLAYAMSTRGACHLQHMVLYVEAGMSTYPEAGLAENYEGQTSDGKAEMVYICENLGVPMNSALICKFVFGTLSAGDLAEMLDRATGFGYDIDRLMQCGERIWLLKRSLNCLMGVERKDDRLPKAILTPLAEGGAEGSVPDIDRMIDEYYDIRGLRDDGRPKEKTLRNAGLDFVAQRLGT